MNNHFCHSAKLIMDYASLINIARNLDIKFYQDTDEERINYLIWGSKTSVRRWRYFNYVWRVRNSL